MRVTVTGATGLIGPRLVRTLRTRGDEVTVLSRDPTSALERLRQSEQNNRGGGGPAVEADVSAGGLDAQRWDPAGDPGRVPVEALRGRDAIVHLAGEPIAQRWSASVKRAIRDSRVVGTKQLVQGLAACPPDERPHVLVSSSGVGYYGAHGEEPLDEEAPPGHDFLAQTCVAWEREAQAAEPLGVRVARVRTGVVLDRAGGALAKMLPPFRLGVGGPIAGGHQYISWIHPDDLVGIVLAAIDGERWSGPINATAPAPQSNRDFSKALGRGLHRPALWPTPGLVLRGVYGEMSQLVTTGARVLPARALMLGYEFRYPTLEEALQDVLR